MAVVDYPSTTYNDTTPQKRVITDIISLIDPSDAPAINALGGLDGASGKFRFVNGQATRVEWLEDSLIAISDTLNESATVTSTIVTLTVTDGSLYEKGHVLQIASEHLWVSAVTGNVISVTRGAFGSTNATQASLAPVTFIGMARLEGAESDTMGYNALSVNSNWTQIMHREIKVTRTQQQYSKYGIADEMAYQADKAVPELMRLLERDLLINKGGSIGSATTPRKMKGIQGIVTTNLLSGASLAQSQFENAVMSIYKAGGSSRLLAFVAPENYQKVKNWYDVNSLYFRIDRSETQVGMIINSVLTPFGEVALVLDRWATTSEIAIIDPNHAGMLTYYPFTREPLAKTGDYEREQVVGEFTFCLRQQKAHALLTAVS